MHESSSSNRGQKRVAQLQQQGANKDYVQYQKGLSLMRKSISEIAMPLHVMTRLMLVLHAGDAQHDAVEQVAKDQDQISGESCSTHPGSSPNASVSPN